MRASLAGPEPPVTTQPTSSSGGNAALQPRMRFDVKEGAKTRPLLTQARRTASSPHPPPLRAPEPPPPAPSTPLPTSFKANTSSRVRAPLPAGESKPVPDRMTGLSARPRRRTDRHRGCTVRGAGRRAPARAEPQAKKMGLRGAGDLRRSRCVYRSELHPTKAAAPWALGWC